jgi:hypothetical protein
MKRQADFLYNERLFSRGFRGRLNYSRFHWLTQSLEALSCRPKSVLELGCYDAKSIRFLPVRPERYVGLDASWEKGLDLAKAAWKDEKNFEFLDCREPDDIVLDEHFEVCICMETLEHVPPDLVEPYLAKLAERTDKYVLVTVPNEKGPIFAVKYLIKRLFGDYEKYTLGEFVNATLGRMDKVRRREHKGFDYAVIVNSLSKYFDLVKVSPLPFQWLPTSLGYFVAIVGKKRNTVLD